LPDKNILHCGVLETGSGYVSPSAMLEFGARSTGEPSEVHKVVCDAAEYLKDLEFPTAQPRTMKAERTFWEKATAAHVFCAEGKLPGDRFARHWCDLVRLDDAGIATTAFADRDLSLAVASHKARQEMWLSVSS
jgi:Nucleotidyl transferase AbiEii toxin, Type IV TA system